MNYRIVCDTCEQNITVRERDAEAEIMCVCGSRLMVPSLTTLQSRADSQPLEASIPAGALVLVVATLALILVAAVTDPSSLLAVGLVMFMVGRIWLTIQILRAMSVPDALMVLLVPFMPLVFLFKRFDIAWMPFFYGICGFLVASVGGSFR